MRPLSLFVLTLCSQSCVLVSTTNPQDYFKREYFESYKQEYISKDSVAFWNTLSPTDLQTPSSRYEDDFQSSFKIPDFGIINAGKTIEKYDTSPDKHRIAIIDESLLFVIETGGGYPTHKMVKGIYWDGKYHRKNDEIHVDLVISFKNLDIRRALIREEYIIDLSVLKKPESKALYINLCGYDKPLLFQYDP